MAAVVIVSFFLSLDLPIPSNRSATVIQQSTGHVQLKKSFLSMFLIVLYLIAGCNGSWVK